MATAFMGFPFLGSRRSKSRTREMTVRAVCVRARSSRLSLWGTSFGEWPARRQRIRVASGDMFGGRHRERRALPERKALVAVLIARRPLCVDCISSKSGLAPHEIEPFLTRIEHAIFVKSGTDRCRACGRTTLVYSLLRET